jgi:hypothetical protein
MGKYKTFGSRFDRVHRNDLNANFAAVEADINAQKGRVDDLIIGTPQPSEVVDSRGGFSVLGERLNNLSSSVAQIATNAQTQQNIQSAVDKNIPLTINIGRTIDITTNLTIPQNIRLVFSNGGKLVIKSGVTLTIDGHIEAGYYQIFEFENSTSVLTTTKYKGEVNVDWFGSDPNTVFNSTTYVVTGVDSSLAFKKCMSFVQNSSNIILNYTPNARYYVTGDNPCGFQNNIGTANRITLNGNNSRIYWKPTLVTDSCFGKLGLLYYSHIKQFDVYTIGNSGDRKGIVFNTKLGFSNIHYFSRNIFESININNGDLPLGCDKVFNFESDGTHSHDDLSEFKNISAANYNIFVNILNNESVKNTFLNCSTGSYTNNAKTFNIIAPAFSGYLSIIDHHFTATNSGEVMLYTLEQSNTYPIYIERPRMEVRGEVLFTFCDINSMDVYINGLSFILGGGVYNFDNNYIVIGQYARLTLDRCSGIYGNVKLKERTVMTGLNESFIAKQSSFFIKLHSAGALTRIGYPNIRYDSYSNRTSAITAYKIYKRVKIEDSSSTNDEYNLPIVYNSTGKIEYTESTLARFKDGKTILLGSFNAPSDIVIDSLFLDVSAFDTVDVDTLEMNVYTVTGGFIKRYTTTFSANTKVSTELITSGKQLTLPFHSTFEILWKKAGVTVTDQTKFPQSRLKMKYRASMTTYEANNGTGGEINLI